MANKRVGGIIELKVNGDLFQAKGSFTYNLGAPKRETVVGSDAVHGYKELPQEPMIEGKITDSPDLDLKGQVLTLADATATLKLANGKIIVLREAFYAGDGNATTEEGEIEFKLSGTSCEEVR